MEKSDSFEPASLPSIWLAGQRLRYEEQIRAIRETFEAHSRHIHAGGAAVEARSAAVDGLIREVWAEVQSAAERVAGGIALVAVGGYGRRELFPHSDIDLMFLLDSRVSERSSKAAIQRANQLLWDAGLRVSALTRTLVECERFNPENVEFTLALMDARPIAGDQALATRLIERSVPKVVTRDAKKISARLLELIRARHARFGNTLFHLEPNIKEIPGGLRDAHACAWLARLGRAQAKVGKAKGQSPSPDPNQDPTSDREFREARGFVLLVRTFLHLRHGRDDNTLDWQAQDAAAAGSLGIGRGNDAKASVDAAFWMRQYFRHARSIERAMGQYLDEAAPARGPRLRVPLLEGRAATEATTNGFEVKQHRISFTPQPSDPAHDPEAVLAVFGAMAATGARLSADAERRIEHALPVISAHLEDGPGLWRLLQRILTGGFAGAALRTMHALGILELVIPEFHGIDALVIRDAYHRYTVDEHTFVLIDTLHRLGAAAAARMPIVPHTGLLGWESRFGGLLRDLPHKELLFLASLLHDTGKGHATGEHAAESTRMASNVLERLELDPYESGLVLDLIRNHLEMSAALRRDVFDRETIRNFAARVPNPELLRMLALFTYADIDAVHPDALTPWKAENLWRLYNATANYLDRNVDDERVAIEATSELRELMHRIHALLPTQHARVNEYLEGFPQRYLQTRTPDVVRKHIEMASRLQRKPEGIELDFRYAPGVSELTLVTQDRPMLFATIAGALAGWGMNIVTADAFSNAQGVVVDSFRFSDTFRTLELNEPERERFVASIADLFAGKADLEVLLASRRRARRKAAKTRVESRVDFDNSASSQSTLMQVVTQDTPGLLRALSLRLAEQGCNIEVALVDTEGETAIDVFYVTRTGGKLDGGQQESLRLALLEAIERNAG